MLKTLNLICALLFLVGAVASGAGLDDAKDMKSKDANVRLEAVQRIVASDGDDVEKLLLKALKDKDWEVVLVAAKGLASKGGSKSVSALVKLAYAGPTRAVRRAAATSASELNSAAAMKGLSKKMSGDTAMFASEAFGLVASVSEGVEVPRALSKLLKSKETLTRAAAAHALVLSVSEDRLEVLGELLFEDEGVLSEQVAVVASALEAMALRPTVDQVDLLMSVLAMADLIDVLERRVLPALVASLAADEDGSSEAMQAAIEKLWAMSQAASGARLGELALAKGVLDKAGLTAAMTAGLKHAEANVRAAAAHALGMGEPEAGLEALHAVGSSDKSARVRRAALAAALSLADVQDENQRAWVKKRLGIESDAAVREDLAVALGVEDLEGVENVLLDAMGGSEWGVAVCAAVSLGRTRSETGVAKLGAMATGDLDWRKRGAAVVGLCHAMRIEGVPFMIQALGDVEPAVVRTAHAYLKSIAKGAKIEADQELWQAWWDENQKRVRMVTPAEAAKRREEYGYELSARELYAGLDVMVFESRGDHIETVLDFIGIQFRHTSSSKVTESGLNAGGVFVSNCTGEMVPADIERLQWFVKTGGYLFGSCWAVHETIERVSPGAVRKLETMGEVTDRVTASPCDPSNAYLKGVFPESVTPIYSLLGAHLIEVLEPERVEVLVDSPECAERWGGGNMTAWFKDGHGKILDSVNHFDAQGLAQATGIKKPQERQAFALDHMGISYAKIRETLKEKWWSSNTKAAEEIRDLSVFNLITNFVRARRIESY